MRGAQNPLARRAALVLVLFGAAAQEPSCVPATMDLCCGRVDATLCNAKGKDKPQSCVVLVTAFAGDLEATSATREGDIPVWGGEVLDLGCVAPGANLSVGVWQGPPITSI